MSTPAAASNVTATIARPTSAPVRRVVTGHSSTGKSLVLEDAPIQPRPFLGKGPNFFTDIFWTDASLADNGPDWTDTVKDHVTELVGPEGSSFRAVEYPPGTATPFHRTVTLDYAVLTEGSLTVILDDDVRFTLNAGDVLIQRGTIHGFHNEGTEWARLFAIMLPSEKVEVGEKKLEQEFQAPRK